ncbi:hypothetical protein T03_14613 [Trichinella britovi]|uniref:Uncharacterized protein n=1 Tax=Trichinella britovi TaxID=45882 RepID=A0A0V1CGW0_TRIBR|nr:hypothetical protein T03_14613 [Trichinella britovi]
MVRNESACERNWMKFSLAYGIEFYCEQNRTNKRLIIRNISKKFQCTKTGFERCVMQITIAIKVPYRQLGRTRSFDLRGKW